MSYALVREIYKKEQFKYKSCVGLRGKAYDEYAETFSLNTNLVSVWVSHNHYVALAVGMFKYKSCVGLSPSVKGLSPSNAV